MLGRRGWMWTSLTLAIVIGVSAGVIADRLILDERLRPKANGRTSDLLWFACDGSDVEDVEQAPAYPYQPKHRRYLVDRLSRRLELDPEQTADLEALLEAKREDARSFWVKTRDSYCRMQSSFRIDIRSLLRPEQAAVYDDLVKRIDAHHRERLEGHERSRHPIDHQPRNRSVEAEGQSH